MIEKLIERLNVELDRRPMDAEQVYGILARINATVREHPWWLRFQEHCPGWDLLFCLMDKDEIIDKWDKIIYLSARLPDAFFRWAHATGHAFDHLDVEGRAYTEEEEAAADRVATCFSCYSPPLDMEEVA